MSYQFEIEIFEGNGGILKKDDNGKIIYPENLDKEKICAWMYRGDGTKSYKKGMIFKYPEEAGKLCSWMLNDIHQVVQVLRLDGKMLWDYKDTPYEKEINQNGQACMLRVIALKCRAVLFEAVQGEILSQVKSEK